MNPAPSVIIFTVFSGLGFGFLAALGFGVLIPAGWAAFGLWAVGYGLAVGGLIASTAHLGNPQRALLAFTQWRSSWLSREAWASVATLLLLAPVALSDWLGLGWPRGIGALGGVAALVTIFTTSMIYAQLKTVPRWNQPLTPVLFLTFAVTGGAILSGAGIWAAGLCLVLAGVMALHWWVGDGRFATVGATMGSATGLGEIGAISVFERGHTAGNYLLREMIYVVGRKHVRVLRPLALILGALAPAVLMAAQHPAATVLAAALHGVGALASRWLFFAEAEHVVGLYYGKR